MPSGSTRDGSTLPGHHRNLLFERHTEMASGLSGRFWTQNFGGGREFSGNLIE